MAIVVDGKTLGTDEEGYLLDPADWSEEIARELALRENVVLSDRHWAVIRFMREYYEQRLIAADSRHVMKFLREEGGAAEGRNELFRLFPYGYVKQACKIAGMRKPRAWSTG